MKRTVSLSRRSIGGLLAGAALLLAAAWPAAAEPAANPALIRIGVATGGVGSPPRTGGATIGIVNAQGLLEKEFAKDGIQVQWIFFKGAGPAVNEALVNKQLDLVWQGDLPSIVHRANGVKTKILLGNGVRGGLFLGATPESGIQRIEDLKGKRVAVFKGTNLHLAAVRALAAHGLKESDVKLINLDFAASQAALTTKDIDAFFGYVQLFALRDKGLAKIVWSAAQDNYRFTRQTVLLGTDEFIEKHPQIVQRVVDVVVRTTRQFSEESRRVELFDEWGKAEYPAAVWREDFVGQPLRVRLSPLLDPFLVDVYRQSAKDAYELKLVRSVPEIDSWFDRRFLNAALKAQKLEGYWPEYAANGQHVGSQPAAATAAKTR